MKEKIIVALDGVSKERALDVARELHGLVWGFKLTDLLFADVSIMTELKKYGNVFADPKLYDIPNTVSNEVKKLSAGGADFITVHASGGEAMMRSAKRAAGKSKVLGVTVLTSVSGDRESLEVEVVHLAREAKSAGLDGIVCSGHELHLFMADPVFASMMKVVPGIRPSWHGAKDDQSRTMTPKEALEQGADFLVIGRAIMEAPSPRNAVERVLQEIG